MKELILGGARSGKSRLAQTRAENSGLTVTYIATAIAGDAEMMERIEKHRQQRPATWRVVEEPLHLAAVLEREAGAGRCLLVDCLTNWLCNLLDPDDNDFDVERGRLLRTLPGLPGTVILVSNEVGMGIVPMGGLSRRFRDESGRLQQDLAALCDRVTLTVAGLAHTLKGNEP